MNAIAWILFFLLLAALAAIDVTLWRRNTSHVRQVQRKHVMRRHQRIVGYPGDSATEDPRLAVWERALERLERDGG